jgi:transcriptional regulator with PAS, ATPase and Fis domain
VDNIGWFAEFPGAITICDARGIILALNDKAAQGFVSDGGQDLVGKQVLDCHPEPSRSKLRAMLEMRNPNVYTIEKRGVKKLIYQTPWYRDGQYAGFVELSLEIPAQMPHFMRQG